MHHARRFTSARAALTGLVLAGLVLAVAACAPGREAAPSEGEPSVADGREIAQVQCSACHAIDRTGQSPRADAPPFRTVLQRYDATALSDALISGIKVGHPDMPNFELTPMGADSLLAYLRSIQEPPIQE